MKFEPDHNLGLSQMLNRGFRNVKRNIVTGWWKSHQDQIQDNESPNQTGKQSILKNKVKLIKASLNR